MGAHRPFSEDALVDQIDDDITGYFSSRNIEGFTKKTERQEQGFHDLDKFCGDLVAAYENYGALVLEIKVCNEKAGVYELPSYEENQHIGLKVLWDAGVPVYFAFNEKEAGHFKKNSFDSNLQAIRAPEPNHLKVKTPSTGLLQGLDGESLYEVIESIGNGPFGQKSVIPALSLFFDAQQASINSGINLLSTKILLIIFNKNFEDCLCLDFYQATELAQRIKEISFTAKDKQSVDFWNKVSEVSNIINQGVAKINTYERENSVGGDISFGF